MSVIAASLGNVPPKVMPGSFVCTSPVMLRISDGAVILGSKNSMCDGPPCRNSRTTERSLTTWPSAAAWLVRREQMRQRQEAAEAEAADFEELAAGEALAVAVVAGGRRG